MSKAPTNMKKTYRFFYKLPSGTKLYHYNSGCQVVIDHLEAKLYKDLDEKKVLSQRDIIAENFKNSWSDEAYSSDPIWEGSLFENITVEFEEVSDSEKANTAPYITYIGRVEGGKPKTTHIIVNHYGQGDGTSDSGVQQVEKETRDDE